MTTPAITVVTPVYNCARYIEEAILSVVAQALPLRHVVVDDGSTDDTLSVVEQHAGLLTILRRPHRGHAPTLNAGLALVDTPWVSFLDADDVLEPNALARLLSATERDALADVVVGHCVEFASDEALEPRHRWVIREGTTPGYGPGGVLIRADLLRRLGGFDESIQYGIFVDLFARAKDRGAAFSVIEDVVFRRRIHGGNMSHQIRDSRRDHRAIARAALARRRSE